MNGLIGNTQSAKFIFIACERTFESTQKVHIGGSYLPNIRQRRRSDWAQRRIALKTEVRL